MGRVDIIIKSVHEENGLRHVRAEHHMVEVLMVQVNVMCTIFKIVDNGNRNFSVQSQRITT